MKVRDFKMNLWNDTENLRDFDKKLRNGSHFKRITA